MKIVDYLIIVSTWLLSSYTFSSSDVDFKNLHKASDSFEVQFGIVGGPSTKSIEVESILSSLPYHEVVEVTKRGQEYFINLKTTETPDFRFYRSVFKPYGFEMDARFLQIHNMELKQMIEKEVALLKIKK